MVVVMYVRRSTVTPKIIGKIQLANEWFKTIEEELQEIDITANRELQLQIQRETQTTEFPIFYENHLKPIGTIEDLQKWFSNYKLQYVNELVEIEDSFQMIEKSPSTDINDTEIPTGYIGGTLDTLEWLIRGSTSLLSPSSWFFWASSGTKESTEIKEYPVVQTNWYWRQQKRILRFSEEGIEKIHPITKEIRSYRTYTSIESLVVTNGVFLNFTFLEELLRTVHEYYQISPSTMNSFIESLLQKIPNLPVQYYSE